jgi:hypothetical protein
MAGLRPAALSSFYSPFLIRGTPDAIATSLGETPYCTRALTELGRSKMESSIGS